MNVEFAASLIELKRAFRRLSVRLTDESEAGGRLVVFNASENSLEMTANGTSEGLSATVLCSGQAGVPFSVFRGIARILRFYRGKTVHFVFAAGALRIDHTHFRHPNICVLPIGSR